MSFSLKRLNISDNYLLQPEWFLISVVIFLGFGARLFVSTLGYNFDFESYRIVADIVRNGENVYANTARYNYGPVWFNVLRIFDLICGSNDICFRNLLVVFLCFVDIGIFTLMYRRFGLKISTLFYLNPISIIISGYHNQFDNLAILIAMGSVLIYGDLFSDKINRNKLIALVMLGLSIMTKHIFFVFPFWLAVKQKGVLQKVVVIIVPILFFLLGFLPYWSEGKQGIIQNVFLYKSFNNELFYKMFIPSQLKAILPSTIVWILLLILAAFIYKQKSGFDSLLFYTCVLIIASPAMANQYLAIVIPFVAANPNPFSLYYTIIGTWYLLIDKYGLNITISPNFKVLSSNIYYAILISILLLELIWLLVRPRIITFFNARSF
jgi:hypothetical protein